MSPEPLFADLEIGLHRWEAGRYTSEARFVPPGSDEDVRLVRTGPDAIQLDSAALREHTLDDVAYGSALTAALFGQADMRELFGRARQAADSQGVPLRMRLFIGADAEELHCVRWETLRDPARDAPLLTGERIFFSRYLSSGDWEPARLRPRADSPSAPGQGLRALVVVANPSDLAKYDLAEVDVPAELSRARDALGQVPAAELATRGQANLSRIVEMLRAGPDIFYLVCHGALVDGEPWLWLEDARTGVTQRVSGAELVTRIAELAQRPRLAVLASCQSAGAGGSAATSCDGGVLSALGPRLAEAGIPAVIAMQGDISMDTAAQFMARFFRELVRDGQIDRAVSVARGDVRDRPDWWMPVLFMRLKSGRIWYSPGFAEGAQLEKWPAVLANIRDGDCTPILGPGLMETLIGSRREMARRWADTYHFPMAPEDREDLPQVAQYLAKNLQPMFPRRELGRYLREVLIDRVHTLVDPSKPDSQARLQGVNAQAPLDDLFASVAALRQSDDPGEPHLVLASLPVRIFVTTDPTSLLARALEKAGKHPVEEFCRWNEDVEWAPSIYDAEPTYSPSVERPLVYHLLGRLDEPRSLVITEDDYFDFLIGATKRNDLIPTSVRRALVESGLLFLGFRLDDWDFRVLFRTLMQQEGKSRRYGYAHVAAQVDPEEGRILEPDRARRYLESYFRSPDIDISVFWGSVEDFVRELRQRWKP
jgi:hypothetical protein